ncbi:hypothetical protein FQN57_006939 [Myotisia sp. PD_48]|nr:hypothetical protein FQN57_006939 [Myotisia sp. PD_48]
MAVGIQSLPLEIVAHILGFLPSFHDLNSATLVSAKFNNAFQVGKQSILISVLISTISPDAEADFVLAYRAQKVWQLTAKTEGRSKNWDDIYYDSQGVQVDPTNVWTREDMEGLDIIYLAILNEFQAEQREGIYDLFATCPETISFSSLHRFYSRFNYFLNSFKTRALAALALDETPALPTQSFDEKPTSLPQSLYETQALSPLASVPSLSSMERARLQRAFFRTEIYFCLLECSSLLCRPEYINQFTRSLLFPWELEEIESIVQFYLFRIWELLDRIDLDFIELVKQKLRDGRYDGDNLVNRIKSILEMANLQYFGHIRHRRDRCETFASRGTLAIYTLLTAPLPISRRMLLRSPSNFRNFNAHGLSLLPGLDYQISIPMESKFESNSINSTNFGWRWAYKGQHHSNAHQHCFLRDKGYLFWDDARFIGLLTFAAPCDINPHLDFWGRYDDLPSAVEKLGDPVVNLDMLEEISNIYLNEDDDMSGIERWIQRDG